MGKTGSKQGADEAAPPLRLPSWVSGRGTAPAETLAVHAGAALAILHQVPGRADIPQGVLRARLALKAAEASLTMIGRSERAADLRDELHLLRPGEQPGPGGAVFRQWLDAVERPARHALTGRLLPEPLLPLLRPDRARGTAQGDGDDEGARLTDPVARGARVLAAALELCPREEAAALIVADATLCRAMGWDHVLPVLGIGLKRRDLTLRGGDLRIACHHAVVAASGAALPLARDLAMRAGRLAQVAPRLRSKVSDAAVALFLSRDALSPSVALTGLMTDRSARRLCDRLVDLGAVQELTGRPSFRLYGL